MTRRRTRRRKDNLLAAQSRERRLRKRVEELERLRALDIGKDPGAPMGLPFFIDNSPPPTDPFSAYQDPDPLATMCKEREKRGREDDAEYYIVNKKAVTAADGRQYHVRSGAYRMDAPAAPGGLAGGSPPNVESGVALMELAQRDIETHRERRRVEKLAYEMIETAIDMLRKPRA